MYQDYETQISQEHLGAIFSQMKEPVCLLGGWAVYLTVNEQFRKRNGRNYLGSRDIDLGFHMEPSWSSADVARSALAESIKILQDRGFYGLGSRFVKQYDIDTKKELGKEEAKKRPSYEMFQLYVDPIVDNIHADAQRIVGFPLLDEPLLSHVFVRKKFVSLEGFGGKFHMPTPEILVAMKIKSSLDRTKDDKRIKDISDTYALLWYSDVAPQELKQRVQKILHVSEISGIISKFTREEYHAVSSAIGIEPDEVFRVISDLVR